MRISVYANTDYPDSFGWPYTASLQEWDGTEWMNTGDHEDGDTPDEAVDELVRATRNRTGSEIEVVRCP